MCTEAQIRLWLGFTHSCAKQHWWNCAIYNYLKTPKTTIKITESFTLWGFKQAHKSVSFSSSPLFSLSKHTLTFLSLTKKLFIWLLKKKNPQVVKFILDILEVTETFTDRDVWISPKAVFFVLTVFSTKQLNLDS